MPNNKKGKDDDDDSMGTLDKAVGIMGLLAGAGFAAWGAYKLFTGSESSSRKEEPQLGYSRGPFKPSDLTGELFKPNDSTADWVKVNTDASLKENISSVAIGGVIRDHKGIWKVGFAGKIQGCVPNPESAELWAIKDGLMRAWDRGFKNIEVETDCDSAVRLFNGDQEPSNDLQKQLVQVCTDLRKRKWSIRLKHILRKDNKVADKMAELGHKYDEIKTFEHPPDDKRLEELLASDKKSWVIHGP